MTALRSLITIAEVIVVLLGIFGGFLWANFTLRARSMRSLAAKWRFEYVGPASPKLEFLVYMPKIKPLLPFPLKGGRLNDVRQVWNVIEGERGGIRIRIFDGLFWLGFGDRSQYCTFIACETERNPFGCDAASHRVFQKERISQSAGWTILRHEPIILINPFTTWTMSTRRIETHLSNLPA